MDEPSTETIASTTFGDVPEPMPEAMREAMSGVIPEPQVEVRTKRKYKKRRKVKRRKKRVVATVTDPPVEPAARDVPEPMPTTMSVEPTPPEEPEAETPTNGWVTHADVHMPIMEAEIAWAVEDMFGIPRGLVSKEFVDAARATVKRHYPLFNRSLLHDLLTLGKNSRCGMFVAVPDWAKKRVDRAVRLCDLMETMVADDALS
jgi:hypothetical protein